MSSNEIATLKTEILELRAQLLAATAIATLALRYATNKDVAKEQIAKAMGLLVGEFAENASQEFIQKGSEFALVAQALAVDDTQTLDGHSHARAARKLR
jgi:hypothetical protein